MSHFTVGIFHEEGQFIDKLLAPYQENNMGDCPKQYMEFEDVEDEYLKKYQEDSNCDGVKFSETYKTFEEFMNDWVGHKERDPEKGRYGYWENPNKKWDWWTVGGRYSGILKVKEGAEGIVNKTIAFKDNYVPSNDRADSALIKDIDFEGMSTSNITTFEKYWDKAQSKSEAEKHFMYGIEPGDTKETYVNRNTEFSTYAVITPDGKWHSKGEMGWWGMSSETLEESEKWNKSFKEAFIDNADPELRLTIVDCHI